MEVEYDLTPDDLFAFQWRAVFESPRGRRVRRNVYLGWTLAVLLVAALPAISRGGFALSRISIPFIGITLAIVFLAQWYLERRLTRRFILRLLREEKPDRGQLGRHRLVLSEEGLAESTAVGESRTSWAGVDRVEQNPDYIYIYTSVAGAHVIPKRAFSDGQEAERFYQFSLVGKQTAG